jgi:hypothetical protein
VFPHTEGIEIAWKGYYEWAKRWRRMMMMCDNELELWEVAKECES